MEPEISVVYRLAVVVQSLRRVWLLATPWTAAHQPTQSFTISLSLLKLMSIESGMPSKYSGSIQQILFKSPLIPFSQNLLRNGISQILLHDNHSSRHQRHLLLPCVHRPRLASLGWALAAGSGCRSSWVWCFSFQLVLGLVFLSSAWGQGWRSSS